MSDTLGRKRMGLVDHPPKDETVFKIKEKTGELIDLLETLRSDDASGEKHRLIALAQTKYEEASMWATKSNFTD